MRFFESVAKQIFQKEGIPILEGHVANYPEEAMAISSEMNVPVVVKAQVLTGGRGKAGGIKFADNPGEALKVADEVMDLHYSGLIGLIPLTTTMHKLVHNGRIFIPLQFIYHKYNEFYAEYEDYMNEALQEKLEAKVNLSLHTEDIVSDSLDVEFTYLSVDGFKFPEIPDSWKNVMLTASDTEQPASSEE